MSTTLDYITQRYSLDLRQASPITIAGLSRYGLADLFAELGFMRGVEIGVQAAKYSNILCRANPTMELYGIDPYLEYDDIGIPGEQAGQDQGYEIAMDRDTAAGYIPSQSDSTEIFYYISATSNRGKTITKPIVAPDGFYKFLVINSVTDIVDNSQPQEFYLSQNYPNPFNPTTKIKFTLFSVIASGAAISIRFSEGL